MNVNHLSIYIELYVRFLTTLTHSIRHYRKNHGFWWISSGSSNGGLITPCDAERGFNRVGHISSCYFR